MPDDGLKDPVGDQEVPQIVGAAVVGADQPVRIPLGGVDIGIPNAVLFGQLPKDTRSEGRGAPASSFTNQSGWLWNTSELSSAMKGATQMAGSKPASLIRRQSSFPPPAKPSVQLSQSPM